MPLTDICDNLLKEQKVAWKSGVGETKLKSTSRGAQSSHSEQLTARQVSDKQKNQDTNTLVEHSAAQSRRCRWIHTMNTSLFVSVRTVNTCTKWYHCYDSYWSFCVCVHTLVTHVTEPPTARKIESKKEMLVIDRYIYIFDGHEFYLSTRLHARHERRCDCHCHSSIWKTKRYTIVYNTLSVTSNTT